MLKKEVKWDWTKNCERALQNIKKILISVLLFAHFDPKQEITVATDMSDYGIGAVISHRFEDGMTKLVTYASRTLLPIEKNYSQIEKEGFAIIFTVKIS